ncbi:MAG TPA: OprD family outer membrane porin [Candidatus Baltobacteraceae bacterium]|nr:OprD family outer membrane porin [Candidatus Baltobacteraceae bacterium]
MPAFPLNTLAEAYIEYKSRTLRGMIGDQNFDSPWAGASDSRIKAAYYQGISVDYEPSKAWRVQLDRMTQWENRTSSSFNKSDLIVPLAANGSIKSPTSGFLLFGASYTPGKHLDAVADFYQFYDIATLLWVQAEWNVENASGQKSGIGLQFGSERAAGAALVGNVSSDVAGAELRGAIGSGTVITLDYDHIPPRTATISLPSGVTCTNHVISGPGPTGGTGYWLPTSGTPNCTPTGSSAAIIYYGGMASPYSDTYSTSPLYVTNMSQDMVQRRSPGDSFKLAATFFALRKQLTVELAQIWNDYTNGAGAEVTSGTSVDAEYRFSRTDQSPYHGFSLRNRWLSRVQTNTEFFGGKPLTAINRTQLEFDF